MSLGSWFTKREAQTQLRLSDLMESSCVCRPCQYVRKIMLESCLKSNKQTDGNKGRIRLAYFKCICEPNNFPIKLGEELNTMRPEEKKLNKQNKLEPNTEQVGFAT